MDGFLNLGVSLSALNRALTPSWVLSGAALDLYFSNGLGFNSLDRSERTPDDILTYTSPSPKMVTGADGVLRYAPHNLALNTVVFSGGSVPTSWTQLAPDGSRTLVDSIYWPGHQAIRFVASTQRPGLQSGAIGTIPAGTNGEVSFTVEAVGIMPAAWQDIIFGSNSLAVIGIYVNGAFVTASLAAAPSIVPGDRVAFRFNATSDNRMRFGLGCAGNSTGDITLSAPMLRRLPSGFEDYLENPSTTAACYSLPIDHDPITHAPLGVLIEEQRTNLLVRAQEFDNAVWQKIRSTVTANAAVAPDGTTTAAKLVEDATAGNTHHIQYALTSYSTYGTHAQSIFLKAGERRYAQIRLVGSANSAPVQYDMVVDLQTGTITATNGTPLIASIQSVGNGWYRACIGGSHPSGTQINAQIYVSVDPTYQSNPTYNGDGTSGIYIWGGQLELGAFPTSYIPTVASQVTRAADQVSIAATAYAYSNVAGSWFANYDLIGYTSNYRVVSNGSFYRWFYGPSSVLNLATYNGSVAMTSPIVSPVGRMAKVAMGWDAAGQSLVVDNGTLQTNVSSFGATIGTTYIGQDTSGNQLNGHIKRLTYFPTRKSNAELQALTA